MTAREFKRRLQPLGKVEIYEEYAGGFWRISVFPNGDTGREIMGPGCTTVEDARSAFLDSLRWLQAKERRIG